MSGCPNCCVEPLIKDIGMYGTTKGYTLAVGGNSGLKAQIARVVAEKVSPLDIPPIIRSILIYYRQQGKSKERLGQTIDRLGWEEFRQQILPEKYNQ